MKFDKTGKGQWCCYQNPFTFWLYEFEDRVDAIWHYGDASGTESLENLDKAKLWCSTFAADRSLKTLKNTAPENGRVRIDEIFGYEFVCDGAVSDMGYYCILPIGHKGECYCRKGYFKSDE